MGKSVQILVLTFMLTVKGLHANYYKSYKVEEPFYTPQHFYPHYENAEVKLHKLCSWNVLEWEDPVIKDMSDSKIRL